MTHPHNLLPKDWPALAVGLIVGAYWWRVVRMALKMRRRTGRAANFIPTEPLGRLLRCIWNPVIAIWVGVPIAVALWGRPPAGIRLFYHLDVVRWAAVAVVLGGYVATRVCWVRMGKSWRMGIDPGERTALVFTGPFARVRHPIYALSSLMMVASVVAVPSPTLALAAVVHLLLLQWEARREESHLSRIHGPAYDEYRAGVGRFVPRLGRARQQRQPAAPSAI